MSVDFLELQAMNFSYLDSFISMSIRKEKHHIIIGDNQLSVEEIIQLNDNVTIRVNTIFKLLKLREDLLDYGYEDFSINKDHNVSKLSNDRGHKITIIRSKQ